MTWRATNAVLPEGMGLAGRLLAIVLAVLVIDFAINSVLFERESAVVINAEEGLRVAEQLVVARRVLDATPPEQRSAAAGRLSTRNFTVGWRPQRDEHQAGSGATALRNQIVRTERDLAGADLRLHLVPLSRGGGLAGSAILGDQSILTFRAVTKATMPYNAGLLLRFSLPSVLLLVLTWWLVQQSFRSLNGLVKATSRVGTDDMEPLPEEGQREVRLLVRAFNRMHERIHQLLTNRTETLLAIGHDLRTPMARLQLRLDGATLDPDTRAEMAADVQEMDELLRSLQVYVESGRETRPAEPLDLATMVRTLVDDAADHGADASYCGPDQLEIRAHPLSLRRAIGNLLQNALRYAGSAEVELRVTGGSTELTVADRGPGIPPERLAEVLQPFTRLDEARARNTRGMGLGLAIVDRIIRAEGGQLILANRPGGGLLATIALPYDRQAMTRRNIS